VESQLKFIPKSRAEAGAETTLVIFPGALGDFVCFLPALERLARRRSVALLARSEYADLAPAGVYVRSLQRREISRLFVLGAGREKTLERFFDPYGSIYSWTGSEQEDFRRNLKLLSGGRAKLFPFRPSDPRLHISDYYLSCVGEEPSGEIFPTIPLRPNVVVWGRRCLGECGLQNRKILGLAPGSGSTEKNWPMEFFRQAQRWWEGGGGGTVVILGPAEEGWQGNRRDWGSAVVIRSLELAKVAALLSLCDLYLGNDSGLTHLAAAVGVKTVALFGPTDPTQWAPRGKRVSVVSRNIECSPCAGSVMKGCPHRRCLTALRPDVVIGLLQHLLERRGAEVPQAKLLDKGRCRH